jgi:hypothetical protein
VLIGLLNDLNNSLEVFKNHFNLQLIFIVESIKQFFRNLDVDLLPGQESSVWEGNTTVVGEGREELKE